MQTEPYGACTGPARHEVTPTDNSDDPIKCACGRPATGHDARRDAATCRQCAHLRADGEYPDHLHTVPRLDGGEWIRCATCGATAAGADHLDHVDGCPHADEREDVAADGAGHELVDDADDAAIHVDSITVHRAGDRENARPWGVSAVVVDRRPGRPYTGIKVEYDLDGTTAVLRSIHAEPFSVRDVPLVAAADDTIDALPFVNAVSGVEQELQARASEEGSA